MLSLVPENSLLYNVVSIAIQVSNAYARCVYEKYGGFVLVDSQKVTHEIKTCVCCDAEVALPSHNDLDVRMSERLTRTSMPVIAPEKISFQAACGRHLLCQHHCRSLACPLCKDWSESDATEKIHDVDYYTSDLNIDLSCVQAVYPEKCIRLSGCLSLRGKRIVIISGTLPEKCHRQNDVISLVL